MIDLDSIAAETHAKLLKLKVGASLVVGNFRVTRTSENDFEFPSLTGHNLTSGSATGIASMVTLLNPRPSEAGFTLIELLIVLAILAIVAVLGIAAVLAVLHFGFHKF